MVRMAQDRGEESGGRNDPTRRCLATGERQPKNRLLRFVVDPQGALIPDFAGRLPGRGLWITPRRDIVERAIRKGLFARAARRPLVLSDDLVERLSAMARRRLLDSLGLARRGGAVVAGFDAVEGRLRAGRVALLVEASDGADDGLRKLMSAARAGGREPDLVRLFDAEELGRALGREPCVHVALASGGIADRFREEWLRLAALLGHDGDTG